MRAEAIMDYLVCPKRFQLMHLTEEEGLALPEDTRQRRSRHFSECMNSVLLFYLFRSMSDQPVSLSTLTSRWGRAFLSNYDATSIVQESHESSTTHHNSMSLNTLGVESILSFYNDFSNSKYQVLEVMRKGILVLPSAVRLKTDIHYARLNKRSQVEVVYLYTGLSKPSLRLCVWPLLIAGLLYQQDYEVKPSLVLSCPVTSAGGREYHLPWNKEIIARLEAIIYMMFNSEHYLPYYAGNCAGCPVGGSCEIYGWRGMS